MPAQRAPATAMPDNFELDANTLAWLEKRYPTVDTEIACERFTFWASQLMYANWQRCFQNFVVREADGNRLAPMLKKPKSRAELLIDRANTCGFREPFKGETHNAYESALNAAGERDVRAVSSKVSQLFKD